MELKDVFQPTNKALWGEVLPLWWMFISVWVLNKESSLSVLLFHWSKYYLSPLTAAWDTLSLSFSFFLLYLSLTYTHTHKTKKKLRLYPSPRWCHLVSAGWDCVRRYGVHHRPPCWGESGRHARSQDMGQIPNSITQLIMSIWVWGISIMECRSLTSMMFCVSWGEAASGGRRLHAQAEV